MKLHGFQTYTDVYNVVKTQLNTDNINGKLNGTTLVPISMTSEFIKLSLIHKYNIISIYYYMFIVRKLKC